MMLIGMFDSPFVRRVAVSMKRLGLLFEHANWSVGKDFDRIRQYNPLGRVPTLVLDDGDALTDSAAILDYLDELVGPDRALLPPAGPARRETLRVMALSIGAAEKGRDQVYERVFRPAEKRHEPWLDRVKTQMHGALTELEKHVAMRGQQPWLIEERVTQADITTGCVLTFLTESVVGLKPQSTPYPALYAFLERCEALPEFKATKTGWSAPAT
jgi:glutathione S-transferase